MQDDVGFLQLFSSTADARTLKAGEVLFRKGDPGDFMYVVKTGKLQIGDNNAVLETVGVDGIFGEMAIIEKAPRSATVTAAVDSIVITVDQHQFLDMVKQTPYFAIRVMRVISARLRSM